MENVLRVPTCDAHHQIAPEDLITNSNQGTIFTSVSVSSREMLAVDEMNALAAFFSFFCCQAVE